jgi:uncharacterized protein YcbK (DUF882 family)
MECEGTVTSWIRSRDRNAKVGGHPNSYHQCGLAVDVVIEDEDLKSRFKRRMWKFGFGVLDEGDHVHVQAIPAGRSK